MSAVEWFEREWDTLSSAPFTFIVLSVLLFIVGYGFSKRMASQRIENLQENLELQKQRAADYKEKLEGASPEEARQKIIDLAVKVQKLEADISSIGPRKISADEKFTMINILGTVKGHLVSIVKDGASAEAATLATGFHQVFKEAGWRTISPMVLGLSNPPPTGIRVEIAGIQNDPAASATITKALTAAGFEYDLTYNSETNKFSDREVPIAEITLTTPA